MKPMRIPIRQMVNQAVSPRRKPSALIVGLALACASTGCERKETTTVAPGSASESERASAMRPPPPLNAEVPSARPDEASERSQSK